MVKEEKLKELCALAKLKLCPEEERTLQREMEEIVRFARQVCTNSPILDIRRDAPQEDRCREEEETSPFQQSEILQNTAQVQEGFFFLPGRK